MKRYLSLWLIAFLIVLVVTPSPSSASNPSDTPLGTYLVGFRDDPDVNAVLKDHGAQILKIRYQFHRIPAVALDLTSAAAEELRRDGRVEYVEPDARATAQETLPWGIVAIKADAAHSAGVMGHGVKVGVIDTGVAPAHDLSGAKQVAFGGLPSEGDQNGHGTHVAGILAARVNGVGTIGVAPEVDLYSLKALDASGSGRYSDIVAALEWAMDNGIQIINMSFGSQQYSRALEKTLEAAYRDGILLVASAGNYGDADLDTVLYPARLQSVIAVGALDRDNHRAFFSSVGPDLELMAPGVAIYSTLPDDQYGEQSGTSMAAPHVAGAAALLLSHNSSLRNADIREILHITASPLGDPAQYGYGLVDVDQATAMSNMPRGTWKKTVPSQGASHGVHGPIGH